MAVTRRSFIGGMALGTVELASAAAPTAEKVARGLLGKVVGVLPPGRYDAHMHVFASGIAEPRPEEFWGEMRKRGLAGGCLFSASPNVRPCGEPPLIPDPERAMDNCLAWCSASPTLYPFYWIDPGAPNALELVDMAVAKGFYGFKVIRNYAQPCDAKTLPVYAKIAASGRPLLFHSGILFDGMASSQFFHPTAFEPLLDLPGLRFALAHVSWPWHDECIAVYGKIQYANIRQRKGKAPKMFIDTTPGSPRHYRREVLSAVYEVYNVTNRIMFGTDSFVSHYDARGVVPKWMELDDAIFAELGKDAKTVDAYYRAALSDFLFGS